MGFVARFHRRSSSKTFGNGRRIRWRENIFRKFGCQHGDANRRQAVADANAADIRR
jgi:hypothetical protein